MDTIDFNFLVFIKETYPISAISIVLVLFGYTLGSIGFRCHVKTLKGIISDILHTILERLH